MRVVDAGCEPELVEPEELAPEELEPVERDEPDDRVSDGEGWLRGRAVRPVLPAPTPGW